MGLFGPPNVDGLKARGNVGGLLKALEYRKDSYVCMEAAKALGEIGYPRAVEPLITALRDSTSRTVKGTGPLIMQSFSPFHGLSPVPPQSLFRELKRHSWVPYKMEAL